MTPDSKPQVALITGSSTGIGLGIARELARRGLSVVITSRDEQRARKAAEDLNRMGGQAVGLPFDIERSADLQTIIDATLDTCGGLDVLVNNALSQTCIPPLDSLSADTIELAFRSNITHTLLLTRQAYPHLKARRGSVINIGSTIVNRYLLGLPMYSIVKAALIQMTRSLAAEWAPEGIRVNAINPGFIRTDAFSSLGMPEAVVEQSYEFYKRYIPQGRIGTPEDVGRLAAFLASEEARLITGAVVAIDGGLGVNGLPLYQGQ
jgi:NAD(P)-dependent dehydrogenase (short-subunit alcohol dehydrogenase family)